MGKASKRKKKNQYKTSEQKHLILFQWLADQWCQLPEFKQDIDNEEQLLSKVLDMWGYLIKSSKISLTEEVEIKQKTSEYLITLKFDRKESLVATAISNFKEPVESFFGVFDLQEGHSLELSWRDIVENTDIQEELKEKVKPELN